MWKMITLWEKGKDSTPAQYAYLQRIDEEGMFITGRPGTRRRITRRLVKIAGKRFIVNTVFELDGTTKVFMVPFVVVNPVAERKDYFENLKRILLGFSKKEKLRNTLEGEGGDDYFATNGKERNVDHRHRLLFSEPMM